MMKQVWKRDANLLLDQEWTVPDMTLPSCSQNETSSNGIEKKEDNCPRYADGYELSPYEIYLLSKIERNHSYLKKLGLGGHRMLKKETVCKKRKKKDQQQEMEIKRTNTLEVQGQDNVSFEWSGMKRKFFACFVLLEMWFGDCFSSIIILVNKWTAFHFIVSNYLEGNIFIFDVSTKNDILVKKVCSWYPSFLKMNKFFHVYYKICSHQYITK